MLVRDRSILPPRLLGVRGIGLWAVAHGVLGFFLSLFMGLHTCLGTTGATVGELFRLMVTGKTEQSAHRSITPITAEARR